MSKLILARHGQSKWNQEGRWTGLTDIALTETGIQEALAAGKQLQDMAFDIAFVSELIRAKQTLESILSQQKAVKPEVIIDSALNEKDYGVYTGKNKQQVLEEVGRGIFQQIRRSWDYPIENGESLKDVHARVATFHQAKVMPRLALQQTVLVVSHNNTLRAYVKELEDIPDNEVGNIELGTGEIRIYDIDSANLAIRGLTIHRFGDVH